MRTISHLKRRFAETSLAISLLVVTFASTISTAETQNSPIELPNAIVGQPYAVPLPLTSAVGQVTSTHSGNLPDDMSIHGIWLKGQPRKTGRYTFSVTSQDELNQSATCRFVLNIVSPPAAPLKIQSNILPECIACRRYIAPIYWEGGYPPYTWRLEKGTLPNGLNLKNGQISGIVLSHISEPQDIPITISVTDKRNTRVTQNYHIKLKPNPEITLRIESFGDASNKNIVKLPTGIIGQSYFVLLPIRGGYGRLNWVLQDSLPLGLTQSGHVIAGNPSESGVWTFSLIVQDTIGQELKTSFGLTMSPPVPGPVQIVTRQLPHAVVGEPYRAFLEAQGGMPPYQWEIASGELPSWANLQGNKMTGLCMQAEAIGTHTITVRVADSSGAAAHRKMVVSLAENPRFPPPRFATDILPVGMVGTEYWANIPVNNGLPPYHIENIGGRLPDDLKMDSRGVIQGKISQAGTFTIVLSVRDRLGQTSIPTSFSLTSCEPAKHQLAIGTFGRQYAVLNKSFEFKLPASGGLLPYHYSLESELPKGLKWDSNTGLLSGKPKSEGTTKLKVRISDSSPGSKGLVGDIYLTILAPPALWFIPVACCLTLLTCVFVIALLIKYRKLKFFLR